MLSKLQQADPARVSYAEILAAEAQPPLLVAEGVAEYGAPDDYVPEDCSHGCVPNVDYDRRASEGLVGVACPHDDACWPGLALGVEGRGAHAPLLGGERVRGAS